jgi:rhodanese-related sulfurtransferase
MNLKALGLKFTQILLFCLICSSNIFLQAQNDPFAGLAVDAAALSPSELPCFEEHKASPEDIQVSEITTGELNAVIKDGREKVFILDARNGEEYNVSHIKNAKRCGYNDFSAERIWMVDRKARVIIYSTTGERGIIVAQYLKLMGFVDIQTLSDNLIGWKNDGYEVIDSNGKKTDKIHVGDRKNMKLLRSGSGVYH